MDNMNRQYEDDRMKEMEKFMKSVNPTEEKDTVLEKNPSWAKLKSDVRNATTYYYNPDDKTIYGSYVARRDKTFKLVDDFIQSRLLKLNPEVFDIHTVSLSDED